MPPAKPDEILDSDDEDDISTEGSYTLVTLGVPDGDIQSESDLSDPRVSRIGGKAVRQFLLLCNYIDQYMISKGICQRCPTRVFLFAMQDMFQRYGADRTTMVPHRRQPYGPCHSRVGLFSCRMSTEEWLVWLALFLMGMNSELTYRS